MKSQPFVNLYKRKSKDVFWQMNPITLDDRTCAKSKIKTCKSVDENPRFNFPNENEAKIIQEQSKRIFAPFHPYTNNKFDSDEEFKSKVKKLYQNVEK